MKAIYSLASLGLALTSFADPNQLYYKLSSSSSNVLQIIQVNQTNSYSLSVKPLIQKDIPTLSLTFKDETTSLNLIDKGANGVSYGDELHLTHNFQTGEILEAKVIYFEIGDYYFSSRLYNPLTSLDKRLEEDTREFNAIRHFLFKWRTKPLIEWGSNLYNLIAYEISSNQLPKSVPYLQTRATLSKFEPILPFIAKGKSSSARVSRLLDEYQNSINLVKSD